jgi:hypothetical protein
MPSLSSLAHPRPSQRKNMRIIFNSATIADARLGSSPAGAAAPNETGRQSSRTMACRLHANPRRKRMQPTGMPALCTDIQLTLLSRKTHSARRGRRR